MFLGDFNIDELDEEDEREILTVNQLVLEFVDQS